MKSFEGERVLITGGTGSLGQALVRRILEGVMGRPEKIIVFSRDEAKQHQMRLEYRQRRVATEEIIYQDSKDILSFRIGDIRDYASVASAVQDADVILNAAALKQVPICEYFPYEAFLTNVVGAQNIVRAIRETPHRVETVVGISTDKACKPVNVMGMTKALQERLFLEANLHGHGTRFICVRYGNVIASRGSVVPLFLDQIRRGGPVTITSKEMTRFLLTMDHAVETIFDAVSSALPGETYVPQVRSARVVDLANALMAGKEIPIAYTGVRPGEKLHEILVSEDECHRTMKRNGYFVVRPILPELQPPTVEAPALSGEYSSATALLDFDGVRALVAPWLREPTLAGEAPSA